MRRLLEAISDALGETTMGLLALGALALGALPFVFEVGPEQHEVVRIAEWAIVGLFAVEYLADLALAPSKRAYLLDGWRLLDVLIIATPFAGIWLHRSRLVGAPAVRLIRLARVVGVGARMRSRGVGGPGAKGPAEPPGPETITVLGDGPRPRAASFEEMRASAGRARDAWFHGAALRDEHLAAAAAVLGVDGPLLVETLERSEYPRLEALGAGSALFAWLPSIDAKTGTVTRNGLVVLAHDGALTSLSQRACDLASGVAATLPRLPSSATFATRALLAILEDVLHRYERVAGHFERQLRALELVPVRESRAEFLEAGFRLQRQLAFAKSDLWRLKGILAALAEGRLRFRGLGAEGMDYLRVLADEAGYVYETVFNTREGLLSLIELHLNVVSFEMNKVMRMLAVLSAVGLVPAVAGGLLGMNLVGNPWPITLGQVTYGVLVAMAGFLYVFTVKGWLR